MFLTSKRYVHDKMHLHQLACVVSVNIAIAGCTKHRTLDAAACVHATSSTIWNAHPPFPNLFLDPPQNNSHGRHYVTSIQGCTTFTYNSQSTRRHPTTHSAAPPTCRNTSTPPCFQDAILFLNSSQGLLPILEFRDPLPPLHPLFSNFGLGEIALVRNVPHPLLMTFYNYLLGYFLDIHFSMYLPTFHCDQICKGIRTLER